MHMHISWLGTTAIKIQAKPAEEDVTILIDPYKPAKGTFARSLVADVVLYTHGVQDSITVSGSPFLLTTPGECEIKQVLMIAVEGSKPGHTIIRLDVEQMSLAHLGLVNEPLTDAQLNILSGVDILFIPVGDIECYGARSAIKAIQDIEPRVVIPMAYESDNDPTAKSIDGFLKEMGVTAQKEDKKVILRKKDLPQEEVKVIIVSKE